MKHTHDKRRWLALILVLIVGGTGVTVALAHQSAPGADVVERQAPTSTPVQLVIPSPTIPPTATEPPTRTPTEFLERAMAEALSDETNIRSDADINASRVAQIFPGTLYPVLGRRFEWYQIEFPNSPTGTAWVHQSVVAITGNADLIPDLTFEELPTVDPTFLAQQRTAEAVEGTPGAGATLTAIFMITPTGVFTAAPDESTPTPPGTPPPTFSPPAITSTWVVIPNTNPTTAESEGGIPAIVPILALGAVGLMGLLVGFLRRL